MAPESARGEAITPATDVFAWGGLVAFAATGRSPFGEGRPEAVLYRVVHEEPDLAGLDSRLRPLVLRALARNPLERPSVQELLSGLSGATGDVLADPTLIGVAAIERTQRIESETRRTAIDTSEAKSSGRRWMVVGSVALLAAALIGAGAAVVASRTNGRIAAPPSTTQRTTAPDRTPTTTTSPATTTTTQVQAGGTTFAALPFDPCQTSGFTSGAAGTPMPSTVGMTIPTRFNGQLAVYGDTEGIMQVVAPAGWECKASVGADGSTYVDVVPPGGVEPSGPFVAQQGEAVTADETSACVGCAIDQACPLFASAVAANLSEYGQSCQATKPSAEAVWDYSSTVEFFEDPPGVAGDGVPSGGTYPANGLMTFIPTSHNGSWTETCTLPQAQHAACTVILNQFLSQYGND
jgi:hypothetical protein